MIENLQPKKALGQHWLYDIDVLEAMCDAVDVESGNFVLEIGPGLGTLTSRLLQRDASVLALEFDHDLAVSLNSNLKKQYVNTAKLEVREGDIRTFNFTELPADYKVCANIPYYLTSNLIRLFCDTPSKPLVASILIQKEVAERVAAKDGKMSILSCYAHFFFECTLGEHVPAELFTPAPKVDSQILILWRRPNSLFDVDQGLYFRLIKAGFSGKRKTLRNSLSAGLQYSKSQVETLLHASHISPSKRAETLSLEDWKTVYDNIKLIDASTTEA